MGEWVTGDVRDAPFVVGTDAIEVGPPDELGDTLALVFDKDHARLVAAAPDLRGALDAIVQYMADHGSTIPSNYIERAYAALDKAAAQRDMQEVGG